MGTTVTHTVMALKSLIESNVKTKFISDDFSLLTEDDLTNAIAETLVELNRDSPKIVYWSSAGDGTRDYALPLTNWVARKSVIEAVEYPTGRIVPTYLDQKDFFYYYDPAQATYKHRLRFARHLPTASETFIVRFTGKHAVPLSESASTMTDDEFLALAYGSTSRCLKMMANKTTHSIDPSIAADTVELRFNAREYRSAASEWETDYKRMVGLLKETTAAFSIANVDMRKGDGNDFLYRPTRSR